MLTMVEGAVPKMEHIHVPPRGECGFRIRSLGSNVHLTLRPSSNMPAWVLSCYQALRYIVDILLVSYDIWLL